MKRRRFLQAVAAAPAAPLIAQQTPAPASAGPTSQQPAGGFRGAGPVPPVETAAADLSADPAAPVFFTEVQFATLRRLGGLLQPAMKGHPGATEAGAPEFLDFLVSVSPSDRQKLYRDGLDALNAQARKHFQKSFGDLDDRQADTIVRPLLTVISWSEDLPRDPLKHFLAQAHRDFRTATQNSREWAKSGASGGRRGGRGFGGGVGLYWLPIDPVVKG